MSVEVLRQVTSLACVEAVLPPQGSGESDKCALHGLNMGKISRDSGICKSYGSGAAGLFLML